MKHETEMRDHDADLKKPSWALFVLLIAVVLAVLGLEWLLGFFGGIFKTF